jgi:8-hydroxy-5-deazaflavin:NADPH oxidoreductase
MKIGIIGTGAIGSILAKKLSAAGHQVKVTNTRDMATLQEIAANLGAEAATIEDVVKDVEAIIFSIPFKAYKDLPKHLLQDVPQEVIIMDTSNYYPFRDGELPGLKARQRVNTSLKPWEDRLSRCSIIFGNTPSNMKGKLQARKGE